VTETITLDGRKFSVTQSRTAEQKAFILAALLQAGAPEVFDAGVKRTPAQLAEALLTQILVSGKNHTILAGCFTEEGKVWSRKEADENAARFAAITNVEETNTMRSSIVALVIGFVPGTLRAGAQRSPLKKMWRWAWPASTS
jgi:hypothetical protein